MPIITTAAYRHTSRLAVGGVHNTDVIGTTTATVAHAALVPPLIVETAGRTRFAMANVTLIRHRAATIDATRTTTTDLVIFRIGTNAATTAVGIVNADITVTTTAVLIATTGAATTTRISATTGAATTEFVARTETTGA